MTRDTVGIKGMAIAMITFGKDGPSAAVITSASTKSGSACKMAVTRWNSRLTERDSEPEGGSTTTRIDERSAGEPMPTANDMRGRVAILTQTSRPKESSRIQ